MLVIDNIGAKLGFRSHIYVLSEIYHGYQVSCLDMTLLSPLFS